MSMIRTRLAGAIGLALGLDDYIDDCLDDGFLVGDRLAGLGINGLNDLVALGSICWPSSQ